MPWRLRIFTPSRELPFAGHPSVGAAWVLAQAGLIRTGEVVQECGAGLLPVQVDAHRARVDEGRPEVGPVLEGAALAAAVGLGAADPDVDVPAGACGPPTGRPGSWSPRARRWGARPSSRSSSPRGAARRSPPRCRGAVSRVARGELLAVP